MLVIEDDRVFSASLCDYLRECGYEVTSVYTGVDAIACLAAQSYSTIILDLHLTDMSGLSVLQSFEKSQSSSTVIVISGVATETQMIACYESGADFVLHKPFKLNKIDELIKRSGSMDVPDARFSLKRNVEGWIELTADSYFGFLERIKNVTQVLRIANLDDETQQDVTMALDEMGRNAIEWGNSSDHSKKVSISYALFANEIVFKIEDEGGGFAVAENENEDEEGDVLTRLMDRKREGKRPGGFGITMVKRVMDKVVYNLRGNVVLISKSLK